MRAQIILRVEDVNGYHVVRKHEAGWEFTIERYPSRPENYQHPSYCLPLDADEVAELFAREGKEFRL
jgi:hypothetical protein